MTCCFSFAEILWRETPPYTRATMSEIADPAVRLAVPADWAAVAELLVELGRGVAEGTADDPTHRLQFAGHIRRIENVTLIAERDGDVVGVIDMEYHQRLGDHRPQARVNDLVVTERARGAGTGRALLSRAEELARRRGCFRMALVTARWRSDAISFYERQGWQRYGEWFVKQLSDDVSPGGEPLLDDN
jgi:GNAT superfamily N-acetyltransferase